MKRLAVTVLSIAALLGMKFYNKAHASDTVKQRLVVLCEGDAQCTKAVETHFAACFDQSYKMGGRRQSSRLDGAELAGCINTRAGRKYFAFQSE
jgi:hypothetical protein